MQAGADAQALRDLVLDAALQTDPPLILPSPQVLETGAGAVVAVQVPEGLPHVYSLKGVYWTRTGANNRPLTTPELRQLLLDRSESGYESKPVADARLEDLDESRVSRYLDQVGLPPECRCAAGAAEPRLCHAPRWRWTAGRRTGPDRGRAAAVWPRPAAFPAQRRDDLRALCRARSWVTNLCARTSAARWPTRCARPRRLSSSNMRRGMRIRGLAREETTEYPLPVVREAIVNAIAHRDYSIRGEGTRVLMFSDRLEVYSPGRLPGHVTLANLKDERYSRNEAIVAVLSDMGYIERLGYGIDRMIATMQEAGLPEPLFEETSAGFRVTLRSASPDLVSAAPQAQQWGHSFLNERQEAALAHIRQHGRITNGDLAELYPDVHAETIRRDLADLVERNMLLRIGTKRATYYILK